MISRERCPQGKYRPCERLNGYGDVEVQTSRVDLLLKSHSVLSKPDAQPSQAHPVRAPKCRLRGIATNLISKPVAAPDLRDRLPFRSVFVIPPLAPDAGSLLNA